MFLKKELTHSCFTSCYLLSFIMRIENALSDYHINCDKHHPRYCDSLIYLTFHSQHIYDCNVRYHINILMYTTFHHPIVLFIGQHIDPYIIVFFNCHLVKFSFLSFNKTFLWYIIVVVFI